MPIKFLSKAQLESGSLAGYSTPLQFAQTEVSFVHDISARQEKFDLSLTPYLKDV